MKIKIENTSVYATADWAEIVKLYRLYLNGLKEPEGKPFRRQIKQWKDGEETWFNGNTGEEMLTFLDRGYELEASIDPATLPMVTSQHKRARYTDDPEGEYSHDLYNLGEVDYFLTNPKRESLIGLRLNIEYDFNAIVDKKVVSDYAQWIGSVINALQKRGYDLEINLRCESENSYVGLNGHGQFNILVSKFGERVMPFDWSALFAPGGFRHFFFMMIYQGQEEHPLLTATSGLGRAASHDFDINWNPKLREIDITTNGRAAKSFPAEAMTKKFESWVE